MAEQKEIIFVGAFHELVELAEAAGCRIAGIIDNRIQDAFLGYPVLGGDGDAEVLLPRLGKVPLVIAPDLPAVRHHLVERYRKIGWKFATLIHPQAMVSRYAEIADGVVIQYGVNVSAGVNISNYVKINTYANIMHDTRIGAFSTIAPNAVVLGRVHIGQLCYIGANSTILPDKSVGDGALVGAAAVVTRDVAPGRKVAGIPAREMQ